MTCNPRARCDIIGTMQTFLNYKFYRYDTYLSGEELEAIRAMSKKEGLSLSRYTREVMNVCTRADISLEELKTITEGKSERKRKSNRR